ncbi:MAG: HAMP domain-containing protein [Lachnospiraceae bacterium]|nr:HAMP domain-containing protein [Lachnospiraceae bacterium]
MKGLLSVSREQLKMLNVEDKFRMVFKKILVFVAIAVGALIVTLGISLRGLMSMQKSYETGNIQGEIRIDIQALSKAFLWAMASPDDAIRQEQLGKAMDKFAEFDANLKSFAKVYSNQANLNKVSADLKTVEQNGITLGEMFNSGSSNEEVFYFFNDTLYPSIDVVVKDLKAVSQETGAAAESVYKTNLIVVISMIAVSVLIVAGIFIFIVNARQILSASILEPVREISEAADSMAQGRMRISLKYDSADELGKLSKDLDYSTTVIENVVNDISGTLDRIASGDFSRSTDNPEIYVEDFAPIRDSVNRIVNQLSDTIRNVKTASSRVAEGSSNLAHGAQDLAEGATDQAAAVEELTASVENVNNQTKDMASSAAKGVELAKQVRSEAEVSAERMKEVTSAMERITEASKQIEQVTNTIAGIAKQTQLLSLNASIEAARAGEMGKGFAVVAEEISSLANESSEAVKSTHELITDTLHEIDNGNRVVEMTTEALNKVQESVNSIAEIVQESGDLAKSQAQNMDEISKGIEQIAVVVQNNTATAQESSAVSAELSTQSEELNDLVGQFVV